MDEIIEKDITLDVQGNEGTRGEDVSSVDKFTHGGSRKGSGRKKVYVESSVRLKCKKKYTQIVKAFIGILDAWPDRLFSMNMPAMFDGSEVVTKGTGDKTWTEEDSLITKYSIMINKKYDVQLFVLAYLMSKPKGVVINHVYQDMVELRWQRPDKVAELMMLYGNLMARKSRLSKKEKEMLEKIPSLYEGINELIEKDQLEKIMYEED